VLRLGTTRLRHADLCALAFTADKKLVSFGRDYVVRTWDPATGKQLGERSFEKDKVHRNTAGYLSADAKRLAVQYDDRVKVFDIASGRELAGLKLTDRSLGEVAARFSPDGGRLAVVDQEGKFQICDIEANTCRELPKLGNTHTADIVFSRDGKRLAVANFSRGAIAWDLATGRELVQFNPGELPGLSVDFNGTGEVLVILGARPTRSLHFVRVSTGQPPDGWLAPKVSNARWAQFGPDGSTLLVGGLQSLQWFNPKAGGKLPAADVRAVARPAFSADGQLVASGGPHAIRVWEFTSGKSAVPNSVDDAPQDEVAGAAVSPDGMWIVTKAAGDGLIRIWDAGGKVTGTIRSNRWGGRSPVFSPDGKYLYGGPPDAIALARWEFPGGKESLRYTFAEPAADQVAILNFALSADGRRLAAITQTTNRPAPPGAPHSGVVTVTVWDAATAKRVGTREVREPDYFSYGGFDPDLRWYFSGARPLAVGGGPEFRLDVPEKWQSSQAAVSRDGRLVAQKAYEQLKKEVDGRAWFWAESRGILVHETATGKRVLTLPVEESGSMAFTPDGRGLVVTSPDGIARWDLAAQRSVVRRKVPGPFVGYYGYSFARSLALFPDGAKAVTGHIDTTALVWDLTPPARTAKKLSEPEVTAAWADLAGEDGAKAYAAIWALADAPADAVPFLKARLKPAVAPAEDDVRKLVARLDAPAFPQREAAAAAIRELGDAAAPALRAVLKGGLSAEQAVRVERLLAEAEAPVLPTGERLRRVRAVAALEWARTAEARKLLSELAAGTAADRPTREAAAAVRRLVGR
jgi:WD40 repeat protein